MHVTRAVLKWCTSTLKALPLRTTPILCADANVRLGDTECLAGEGMVPTIQVVGPSQPQAESSHAGPFRTFLEEAGLLAVNTFYDCENDGNTFFGNTAGSRSRIDYICMPELPSPIHI